MGKRRNFVVVLPGNSFHLFRNRGGGFVDCPGAGQRSIKDLKKFTFCGLSRRVFGNLHSPDRRGNCLPRRPLLGISTFVGRAGGLLPCYRALRPRPRSSILSELLDYLSAGIIERFAYGIAG